MKGETIDHTDKTVNGILEMADELRNDDYHRAIIDAARHLDSRYGDTADIKYVTQWGRGTTVWDYLGERFCVRRRYAWDSPQHWLRATVTSMTAEELREAVRVMVDFLDADDIEDVFAGRMDADGYFTPTIVVDDDTSLPKNSAWWTPITEEKGVPVGYY